MRIDCDDCAVQGLRCGDCVVTAVLADSRGGLSVGEDEAHALAVLADGGLLPRLRLVPLHRPEPTPEARAG